MGSVPSTVTLLSFHFYRDVNKYIFVINLFTKSQYRFIKQLIKCFQKQHLTIEVTTNSTLSKLAQLLAYLYTLVTIVQEL